MKKYLWLVPFIGLMGCAELKSGLDTAADGLATPPEAVQDAFELSLDYLFELLFNFLSTMFGPVVDWFKGLLGL